MHALLQDLRYAFRQLRRAPGFTSGVVLVLALGIGANAAMFTVLEATLFRPLPYHRPGELLLLKTKNGKDLPTFSRLPDILTLRDRSHSLTELAYFEDNRAYLSAPATTPGHGIATQPASEQLIGSITTSANLFHTLGVAPVLGRTFTAAEQQPGRDHVVVLSDSLWRAQFHADPTILGRTVRLDDTPLTVIGVMPPGFAFPAGSSLAQLWWPAALTPATQSRVFDGSEFHDFIAIARRAPQASTAQATAELTAIQQQLVPLYTGTMAADLAPAHITAVPYRESLNKAAQRSALLALLGAVAALWLIAYANVASLILARAAARRREMAVRSALGATRWRLARQTLTESLLLSLAGAALGLALAHATLRLFAHSLTLQLGFDGESSPALHADPRVLFALLALSIVSALLFGLAPSLLTARLPVEQALRQDGTQTGTGRSQHRLQRLLVVSELALSLALLVSCGLLLRTVFALRHVPLGFRTDHVFVVTPHLPSYKYRSLDPNALVYKPLLDRIRTIPGVDSAAITTIAPLATGFNAQFELTLGSGTATDKSHDSISARLRASGPELQHILGFRMLRGRYFNAGDTAISQPVAVVNQTFARLYEPIGGDIASFSLGGNDDKSRSFKIIGVIDDFHQASIAEPAQPELDLNAAQMRPTDTFYQPTLQAHAELVLRSTRDPKSLLPELNHVIEQLNPDLAGSDIRTMDQIVEDSIGSQLLVAHLLETLGGLALIIALSGLYSLLAYLVTLRTRELGLRLALGAQRRAILELVLRQAGALLVMGIAAGCALALLCGQLFSHFLYGVRQNDLLTLLGASLLLVLVGAIAAWLPARRAANLDPIAALRTE